VNDLAGRAASVLIGIATAIVIVTFAVSLFLSQQWIAFAQERAQVTAWTGFTPEQVQTVTEAILHDLITGPPNFDVEVNGVPVLNEREQQHMRDVRVVFGGLFVAAAISVGVLLVSSRRRDRIRLWGAVMRGAIGLIIGTAVLGVVGYFAFDQLFELFHQIFFPAGSYLFDPATDRLVQLFPFQFWEETAMACGAVIIGISLFVAWFARRRVAKARANVQDVTSPAAIPASDPAATADAG
jgi:integral membrane protein (TIGR01906 family)